MARQQSETLQLGLGAGTKEQGRSMLQGAELQKGLLWCEILAIATDSGVLDLGSGISCYLLCGEFPPTTPAGSSPLPLPGRWSPGAGRRSAYPQHPPQN